jgi:di/tricarboxylate transporter
MGHETDILFFGELWQLVTAYPRESGLLAFAVMVVTLVVRFVMSNTAGALLSYFVTEKVIKRFDRSSGQRDSELRALRLRVEELTRELGHQEGVNAALREQLERARRKIERLEGEAKEARRPQWSRLFRR